MSLFSFQNYRIEEKVVASHKLVKDGEERKKGTREGY